MWHTLQYNTTVGRGCLSNGSSFLTYHNKEEVEWNYSRYSRPAEITRERDRLEIPFKPILLTAKSISDGKGEEEKNALG